MSFKEPSTPPSAPKAKKSSRSNRTLKALGLDNDAEYEQPFTPPPPPDKDQLEVEHTTQGTKVVDMPKDNLDFGGFKSNHGKESKSIVAKMIEARAGLVIRATGIVEPKNGDSYQYAREFDLLNVVVPALEQVDLLINFTTIDRKVEVFTRPDKYNNQANYTDAIVDLEVTITDAETGEVQTSCASGYSSSKNGDKALSIAYASARKNALINILALAITKGTDSDTPFDRLKIWATDNGFQGSDVKATRIKLFDNKPTGSYTDVDCNRIMSTLIDRENCDND